MPHPFSPQSQPTTVRTSRALCAVHSRIASTLAPHVPTTTLLCATRPCVSDRVIVYLPSCNSYAMYHRLVLTTLWFLPCIKPSPSRPLEGSLRLDALGGHPILDSLSVFSKSLLLASLSFYFAPCLHRIRADSSRV